MRFLSCRGLRFAVAVWLVASATCLVQISAAEAAGELRLAGPVDGLDSLDPAISRDAESNGVLRQIFRGLVAFDDALRPVPELADAITVAGDGLTYDVALRAGAVFHDGSPIEASDVVYSLTRALSPSTVAGDDQPGGPTFLSQIRGFDDVYTGRSSVLSGLSEIDGSHLRIELSAPQATFMMRLASVPASIVDREQVESDSDWAAHPNGSGPFRVESFSAGSALRLAADDHYVLGTPSLDRVSYRLGTDALQSFNLFQAGDIDIDAVSPLDASSLDGRAEHDGTLTETEQFSLTYLAFRSDRSPLDDVHIRRALALAFPRERIAEIALDGQVAVATGLVPSGMLGQQWAADVPAYDLDAARAEIGLSRFRTASAVPMIRIDGSASIAAEAFRAAVETGLGIDVEIVDHDIQTFLDGLASGAYAAYELTWGADYPDPSTFLASLFESSSDANTVGYANPEVDRLLHEADGTLDDGSRAALYERAQQMILDDAVVIPLFVGAEETLVRNGVTGVSVTPMGILRLETISVDR